MGVVMQTFVGIDFGTTNTAISTVGRDGAPVLLPFPSSSGGTSPTWRSVVYFEQAPTPSRVEVCAGSIAMQRYIDNDGEGRLVQSIKSYLASALFSRTNILNRTWTVEQIIGAFLRQARQAVGADLGNRAVVGRPVRYWGAESPDDETRALQRMRDALALAGFDEVEFEYEPSAAASRYGSTLDHQELVLIADFGGGTSDFSLIRVGPDTAPGDASAILATGGIGVGGDSFDSRVIDATIAPLLGKGTTYRDEMGAETLIPAWIFNRLRRWHHLSFLKNRKTLALLERVQIGSSSPTKIDNLIHLIEYDLGLPLHRSVETTKVALSGEDETHLRFINSPIALVSHITRDDFEGWIEDEVASIERVIGEVLERGNIAADDVDRVFMTGGSSFVPLLRHRLGQRFGAEKMVGGNELTSVAWGLAARAREIFR